MRLQASCSLQFLPWTVEKEGRLRKAYPLVYPLLSFAVEKLRDIKVREKGKWNRVGALKPSRAGLMFGLGIPPPSCLSICVLMSSSITHPMQALAEAAMGEDPKVLEEWKWTKLQRDTR